MKNVVVLIGGKGTSGKSTFISYIQGILGAVKCREFSTIDPVKEIVRRMYEQEQRAIFKAMGLDYPMAYLSTKRPAPCEMGMAWISPGCTRDNQGDFPETTLVYAILDICLPI